MPEGPEVRRMADQLRTFVAYKRLVKVTAVGGRYAEEELMGNKDLPSQLLIHAVRTQGKFLYWLLDDDWSMWSTMGMSGSWRKVGVKGLEVDRFPQKHDSVCFHLNSGDADNVVGSWLFFNDPRHFGTIKFVKGKAELDKKLASLGHDPLNEPFSVDDMYDRLQRKKFLDKPIGQVLMDQSVFCGVGNYIRAEALYASQISPWRKVRDMSKADVASLCLHVGTVMRNSYDSNGATILTWHDADGHSGNFASKFAVYGRKVDPFGNEVIKEDTPDKRTIHWCPKVQK